MVQIPNRPPRDIGFLCKSILTNIDKYVTRQITHLNISHAHLEYFMVIASQPGITQKDISNRLGVVKASTTKAIHILEREGLIIRKVGLEDKRQQCCFVTKMGQQYIPELIALRQKVNKYLYQAISPIDQERLMNLLETILQSIQQ